MRGWFRGGRGEGIGLRGSGAASLKRPALISFPGMTAVPSPIWREKSGNAVSQGKPQYLPSSPMTAPLTWPQ